MENSSKALLIAAAVLIVIILIAVSIKIFDSPKKIGQQATDVGAILSDKMQDASISASESFDIDRVPQGSVSGGEIPGGSLPEGGNNQENQSNLDKPTLDVNGKDWYIYNESQMEFLANFVNGKLSDEEKEGYSIDRETTVYLMEDLNFKGKEWTPVGGKVYYDEEVKKRYTFLGTFDGQGHTISNIKINGIESNEYVGLFGFARIIKNLTLKDSNVQGKTGVGGIVGVGVYIENCRSENNNIQGKSVVGGIVGSTTNSDSEIKNCYNNSNVNSINGEYIGGIVGYSVSNTKIENCTNNSVVISDITQTTDGSQTGGIVGHIDSGIINNCTNLGIVKSNKGRIAGIAGDTGTHGVKITNCKNSGDISMTEGEQNYVGG